MKGYIHSIESFSALDGIGVRSVIFLEGCPYECPYCHNVDAKILKNGKHVDSTEIYNKVKRYYPYIEKGGITFSGGEPLMQIDFLLELIKLFKNDGMHIAIETAGFALTEKVKEVLSLTDLLILDIKSVNEKESKDIFNVNLNNTKDILEFCQDKNKDVWIRQVIIEKWNDDKERIINLKNFLKDFSCVKKVEFLPFKKLCLSKWKELHIPFIFENHEETSTKTIKCLTEIYNKN